METSFNPLIAAAGFLVGVLVGSTGMGGGALMTPIMILLFRVSPALAVGTDLIVAAVTKAFGAAAHAKQRTVDFRLAGLLVLGSVPGSLVGVRLLSWVRTLHGDGVDQVVTKALGIALAIVAASMLVRVLIRERPSPVVPTGSGCWMSQPFRVNLQGEPLWAAPLGGFVIGMLVGLTSVGGGSLVVVFLVLAYRMPSRAVVGTDVFQAFFLSLAAGLAHLKAGNVSLPLAFNLVVGSVPGVLLGSRLTLKVPERALRAALALILLFLGLRIL